MKKVASAQRSTASRGTQALQMLDSDTDAYCGSWIAGLVHKYYSRDMWPILSSCMSGQQKSDWLSLLDLQEGLLTYSSEERFAAEKALDHACFKGIMQTHSVPDGQHASNQLAPALTLEPLAGATSVQ